MRLYLNRRDKIGFTQEELDEAREAAKELLKQNPDMKFVRLPNGKVMLQPRPIALKTKSKPAIPPLVQQVIDDDIRRRAMARMSEQETVQSLADMNFEEMYPVQAPTPYEKDDMIYVDPKTNVTYTEAQMRKFKQQLERGQNGLASRSRNSASNSVDRTGSKKRKEDEQMIHPILEQIMELMDSASKKK